MEQISQTTRKTIQTTRQTIQTDQENISDIQAAMHVVQTERLSRQTDSLDGEETVQMTKVGTRFNYKNGDRDMRLTPHNMYG